MGFGGFLDLGVNEADKDIALLVSAAAEDITSFDAWSRRDIDDLE